MSAEITDTFKACRTCGTFYLSTSDYLRSIYSRATDSSELLLIPNELKLWNIGVAENDGFPQDICTICIEEFGRIFKFKAACLNTQIQFKRIYNRDTKQNNISGTFPNIKTEIKRESSMDGEFIILDGMSDSESEQTGDGNDYGQNYNSFIAIKEEKCTEDNYDQTEEKNGYSSMVIEQNEIDENAPEKENSSSPLDIALDIAPSTSFGKDENPNDLIDAEQESEKNNEGTHDLTCKNCIYHEDDNTSKQSFISPASLQEHIIQKHPADKPYSCTYCSKTFFSINNCNVHVKYEHSEIFEKSDDKKNSRLKRKFKKKLNDSNSFKCSVCQKTLHLKLYKRHMEGHESGEQIKCKQCDFMCESRTKMRNHVMVVHEDKDSTSKTCNVCGKACVSLYALKIHLKEHLKSIPCPYCKEEFENKNTRDEHIWMKHTNSKREVIDDPAEATNGDHTTSMDYNLDNDKSNISCTDNLLDDDVLYYTCALCPSSFTNQNDLLLHHKAGVHTGEETKSNDCLNCKICGKTFELKFSLNQHMRRVHGDSGDDNVAQLLHSFD